ncbi:hypothetical protein DPMN_105203 [Dreissena polymorpha]|uniref:Uncharacterized protein n=1 Tax=Dreissena polymorpha TaxID=45954 RepID=A0A9D4H940_DREPO|nr:hypothetical protein DPMN_105203 [Dreissena polymorpha]
MKIGNKCDFGVKNAPPPGRPYRTIHVASRGNFFKRNSDADFLECKRNNCSHLLHVNFTCNIILSECQSVPQQQARGLNAYCGGEGRCSTVTVPPSMMTVVELRQLGAVRNGRR